MSSFRDKVSSDDRKDGSRYSTDSGFDNPGHHRDGERHRASIIL